MYTGLSEWTTLPYSEYLKSTIKYTQDYQNGSPCLIGEYLKSTRNTYRIIRMDHPALLGISKIYNKIHTGLSEWFTLPYWGISKIYKKYIQDYQNGSPCLTWQSKIYNKDYQNGYAGAPSLTGKSKIFNGIQNKVFIRQD